MLRRSLLAAAMTAPLLFLAVPSRDTSHSSGASAVMLPPPPAPTPTPSRRVFVPGLDIAVAPVVSFVDANHGWAWYELDGRRGLGKTADGGVSWHAVKLPVIPPQTGVIWRPLGPDSVVLHLIKPGPSVEDELIVVGDGGMPTMSYPASQPPIEMLVAELGRYQMVCIDAKGCERTTLIKVGSGPIRRQPPLRSSIAHVVNGADGRLWLTDTEKLFVSSDNGETWIEVQRPADTRGKQLKLSPDGTEAWLAGQGRILRFDGQSWLEQWRDRATDRATEWEPVGRGVLAVTKGREVFGIVENGQFTLVAGHSADYLLVLNDGTIVLAREHDLSLGVGAGADREWTRLVASVSRPVAA